MQPCWPHPSPSAARAHSPTLKRQRASSITDNPGHARVERGRVGSLYAVYDAFNVYRTFGVGDPMPAISADIFAQVRTTRAPLRSVALYLPLVLSLCFWSLVSWRPAVDGGRDPACAQVQALAMWKELAKMRSSLVGSLLGGPLLGELGRRLREAVSGVSPQVGRLSSTP